MMRVATEFEVMAAGKQKNSERLSSRKLQKNSGKKKKKMYLNIPVRTSHLDNIKS